MTMEFFKEFVAGWIGGGAGMVVGHPFDTVKARLQTQGVGGRQLRYRGTFNCFSDILKTEGVRGLYKGMASPLLGMAAINSIIFSVYGSCMRLLESKGYTSHFCSSLIAGAAAGTVQCVVCVPTELIKLRMQLQNIGQQEVVHHDIFHLSKHTSKNGSYTGPWQTVLRTYHTEGIKGLYKGTGVTVWREAPAFATYFCAYDYFREVQVNKGGSLDDLSPLSLIIAGGASGVIGWIVTYPFDVVKSRLQCDGADGTNPQYRGMIHCFRKSFIDGGTKVFFSGLNATLLRAFPVNAATFCTVTMILRHWRTGIYDD